MKANPLVAITAAVLCVASGAPARAGEPAGAAAIVPLWPKGQMPGRGSTGPERELPARGDNVTRLTDINEPTITVFKVPGTNKPTPAVIICPGGAYSILAYDKEGTEIAAWLNSIGITGIVLKYRVPGNQDGAFQDIQRAVRLTRRNASGWNISAHRVGVMGFSAGGHLCARLSTNADQSSYPKLDVVDEEKLRPDFAILVYPAYLSSAAGKLAREEQTIPSLRAKDLTKAQQKDAHNYQPGDVLVTHKATKHFSKGDELRVVRREKRRLIVARGTEEISVSPRQSGLTWTVCEERPLAVAPGERLRLRAVGQVVDADGKSRRIANGTAIIARSVDANGRIVLADGSALHTRQVVHGYAMTSHAAQGLTVDKVFVAGAISQEGLYVSATRGREGIRIFVPDREAFIHAGGLRSEVRMSAMEFMRQHALATDLASVMARGWRHLTRVRAHFLAQHPVPEVHDGPQQFERTTEQAFTRPVRNPRPQDDGYSSRPSTTRHQEAPRIRMRM